MVDEQQTMAYLRHLAAKVGPNMFTNSPMERDDQVRKNPDQLAALLRDDQARFLCFEGQKALMVAGGEAEIALLTRDMVSQSLFDPDNLIYLGKWSNRPIFVHCRAKTELEHDFENDDLCQFMDLRSIALSLKGVGADEGRLAILSQAKSLRQWHQNHAFCAVCGDKTKLMDGGYRRTCVSEACGRSHFPRTDPVVIMAILKGDHCLLGRGKNWAVGRYSTLAGFMEAGESIEEAVRREVMEETGITVGDVVYASSQPWPFPANIMIGCYGIAINEEIHMDDDELEDARWFHRTEIQHALQLPSEGILQLAPSLAIAHQLLRTWAFDDAVDQ